MAEPDFNFPCFKASPAALSFVCALLKRDPEERLQGVNVRDHEYFEGLLHFGLSVPYFSTTRIQESTGNKCTWVWKNLHLHLSRIFLTVFWRWRPLQTVISWRKHILVGRRYGSGFWFSLSLSFFLFCAWYIPPFRFYFLFILHIPLSNTSNSLRHTLGIWSL